MGCSDVVSLAMIATVTLNPSLDEWVRLKTLKLGELNRASHMVRYPGGKGINVSRVVRELGGQTVAYALAGGDDGEWLHRLLNHVRIRHAFVRVDGSTRNNYKIQTATHHVTEINTAGPAVTSASVQQLLRRLLRRRPVPRYAALCGSLPPGASPLTYHRWIRALRHRGIFTALDTSSAALRHGLTAHPWLVKPNRQEAETVLGNRLTGRRALLAAMRELLSRGPTLVILSLAREGALLASAASREVWWAQPPAITTNSAVGAGDSLVGGFLYGAMKRLPLLAAFQLGVACGTAAAMTPGTELCHHGDVKRLVPRVRIRRLA